MAIDSQFNPLTRFSDRVDDYIKYRPSYPKELLEFLKTSLGLDASHVVADIGSGTGISSMFFLENGNLVLGVEPNKAMRRGAQTYLTDFQNFKSVNGTAENTTLDDGSVDFVSAAQAFHWFKPQQTRQEFIRILRPQGWVLLIWNKRRISGTSFLEEYEKLLLNFGTDYQKVRAPESRQSVQINEFFGRRGFRKKSFYNCQSFDFTGLVGRLGSSSYSPNKSHPSYSGMIAKLKSIFEKYKSNGTVTFEYDTNVYYGQLTTT